MQVASNEKILKTGNESAGPIVCRRCGTHVPGGSRFCNMCGVMLQRRDPQVLHQNSRVRGTSPPMAREAPAKGVPSKVLSATVPLEPVAKPQSAHVAGNPNVSTHLKRALEIIQGHQSIPAFSRDIIAIMGMGNDEASLRHLTNTILRDYSITLAVIRVANSAYYNRSGKPICSVARAVTLMGIYAIKRLASGLLLLENYEKRPAGLKELLLLSMLTASQSRQLALRLRMKAAEEVYLCGMFRNLGEVLVAFYFSDLYEQILREIRDNELAEHEACVKIMGFTYEDEVKSAMEPGHELSLNEVLMMALEACHRGAGFDRVVFCLASPDRASVRGRLGLGPSIDDVIEQLQIPLAGSEDPLTLALLTKRDLFANEQHDYRYQDSRLVLKLGASCFGLYPVVVDNLVVGCLYFDRLTVSSTPSQRILDMVARLRNLLAELIARARVHP